MDKIVELHNKPGRALLPQKKIDVNDFPFTLNTTIGCLFECAYCYLQNAPFNLHTDFGKEIKVKTWIPEKLNKDLEKHKGLPQHLKRVQVNPATEGYLPQGIKKIEDELGRDIMREVLDIFRQHWDNGNKWMIHLVTKSQLVLRHLDLFATMADQFQLELTLTTLDEERARTLEGTAPTVAKRLDVIKQFSAADIFVRVMCMPFIGTEDEAKYLRDECFKLGARGFKHKALNYFDETEMLKGNLVGGGGKRDVGYKNLLVKSGEPVLDKAGQTQSKTVSIPDKKWKVFSDETRTIVNSGYSELNTLDWGYIV